MKAFLVTRLWEGSMPGTQKHKPSKALLQKLVDCLRKGEERQMERVLAHAMAHGYSKYTSTLKEAWRISVSGLTTSFASTLEDPNFVVELGPDQDYRSDPVAAFAILEAQRHRQRGIRLEMFLGFLKYYRQSYRDVIQDDDGLGAGEKDVFAYIIDRLFDRIEIGFCAEWSDSGATHLDELQSSNRIMTNEKNKYLTIFESLPFPVILLDAHHQIDNQNFAATLWLGGHPIPGAFYYGAKFDMALKNGHHEQIEPARHHLPEWLLPEIEAFSANKEIQYHYYEREIEAGGDKYLYFIQLSKMMDVSGKFAGSVIMVQNFTDARKAEEERARMKEQLLVSEKMASIGQLAAGVAHEINNPIGFIASNLNRLGEYAADMIHLIETHSHLTKAVEATASIGEELKSAVTCVHAVESDIDTPFLCEDIQAVIKECMEGADRVQQIVADLKDFAHPGLNHPQHADINRCLDSTLNMLRNELKYKATLVKDYGKIPQVLCYPRQLNQVFMNIIVNAAQALEKSGEIRISTRESGDFVRIRITDTGCGMADDQVKRIFEPFYTTKPVGTGTGLGLHIAYQIVQQHKGHIEATSRPGQGTTFTINLPLNAVQ
jgi:signal transduction histidine kinase